MGPGFILIATYCMVFAQNLQGSGNLKGRVLITQTLQESAEIASQSIIQQYALESGRYTASPGAASGMPPTIVVYLKNMNAETSRDQKLTPRTVVMDQKNEQFIPHVLAIERGTEVRFLNSDSICQNVFSLSQAKSFDLGRYPPWQVSLGQVRQGRLCQSILRYSHPHERIYSRTRYAILRCDRR
ncbi:MAG: hypothetical protein ACE5I1_11045 [bacterium]